MADDKTNDSEKPKIIVDDDWKAQARADKEKLAEKAKEEAAAPEPGERQLPPATFETLVSTMATQAMFMLGMIPDPQSGQRYVDMDVAKHHIDMLSVIDEKAKGNLEPDEKTMLDQTLHELRSHYVQLSQMGATRGVIPAPGDEAAGQPPIDPMAQ